MMKNKLYKLQNAIDSNNIRMDLNKKKTWNILFEIIETKKFEGIANA